MRVLPAALTVVALVAGCSSGGPAVNGGPLGGGPVGGGGSASGECVPVTAGGSVAAGEQFGNAGHQVAVIKSVGLWRNRGLQLVSAWVLPIYDTTALGALLYPPTSIPAWAKRVRAVGARIAPSKGEAYNLVVQLRPRGSAGSAQAVTVTYEAGGAVYVMQQDFSWTITRGHC